MLAVFTGAHGQEYITPRFVPTPKSQPTGVVPAQYQQLLMSTHNPIVPIAAQIQPRSPEDRIDSYLHTELPGPQQLFLRESEGQFFDRIAQDMKKQAGAARAIFPEAPIISKERYKPRRFENMPGVTVEPSYVCHSRLLFEQPNFERAGYHFGILQPALVLGVFWYDVAMMPYHVFSDLHDRGESNAGKCLPGDPAPMLWPRERFSVTGLLGQSASILGMVYLFP